MSAISINGNTIDPPAAGDAGAADASGTDYVLVQTTAHRLDPRQRAELEARGAHVLRLVGLTDDPPTYLCRYAPADLGALTVLDFVQTALVYHDDLVVDPALREDVTAPENDVQTRPLDDGREQQCSVVITLHPGAAPSGATIFNQIRRTVGPTVPLELVKADSDRLEVWVPQRVLGQIASIDSVAAIEPTPRISLATVASRQNVGMSGVNWGRGAGLVLPNSNQRYQGNGEVVAICDTGFDTGSWVATLISDADYHPAFRKETAPGVFAPRIANQSNRSWLTWTSSWNLRDEDGHGTHVAGTAVGLWQHVDPAYPRVQGVVGYAPAAKAFIQTFYQGTFTNRIAQLPPNTIIQNNSWGGTPVDGRPQPDYRDRTEGEIDGQVYGRPELLIIFAAGNDGIMRLRPPGQAASFNRQICYESASKNVLTVGNLWGGRDMLANPPEPPFMWRDCVEGRDAANLAAATAAGAGRETPVSVAPSSSKGPTSRNYLKPDVCAPGSGILSSHSRHPTAQGHVAVPPAPDPLKPIGPTQKNTCNVPELSFMTGTSMAAPAVAGIAACIKGALATRGRTLLGRTLKAIIVNSAVSCAGGSFFYRIVNVGTGNVDWARGVLGAPPDCIQGHGRVDYGRALRHVDQDLPSFSAYAGFFEHPGVSPGNPPTPATREAFIYFLPGIARTSVSITLVFYDPPGGILADALEVSAVYGKVPKAVAGEAITAAQFTGAAAGTVRQPDPPQIYANVPTDSGPGPQQPAVLGTVQKITWPDVTAGGNTLNLNRSTQKPTVQIKVALRALPFNPLSATVPFSVAWLSE